MPLLLPWLTLHPTLRDIGFVGYYRGPFFGVIELQARAIPSAAAHRMAHHVPHAAATATLWHRASCDCSARHPPRDRRG